MTEILQETSSLDSTTVTVKRTAATVKGGRRFTFSALVVVGDRRGRVGYGYGKSNEVPDAVEKSQKYARRSLLKVPMAGTTIPHIVEGRFAASYVRMLPATPGTGVVAGGTVRAVLEMAGITDCLTKCYGSTNAVNVVKAVFDALAKLRLREEIGRVRGQEIQVTEIEHRIEKGKQFMPVSSGREKMRAPVNTVGDRSGRGGRGRGGRGRGGDRHGGDRQAPAQQPPAPQAPAADSTPPPPSAQG